MSDMSKIETDIRTKVALLLDQNRKTGGTNGRSYDYTCPSPESYPHQWLWDSSFHAIVLTHLDPERAKKEINTLLANQREDGFIPCVSVWEKRTPWEKLLYIGKITQPPVIPIAVEAIYAATKDSEFVREAYPKLKNFMAWIGSNRDKNNNGLVEIIHPWEDGDDGNPSFDKQMGFKRPSPTTLEYFYALFKLLGRYQLMGWDEEKIYKSKIFIAETALFNSIYARSLLSMAYLAKTVGENPDQFAEMYRRTKRALIKYCWNEKDEIFYDLGSDRRQSKVKTTSSLMPLILPDLPARIAKPLIEKHLLNEKEFWSAYPITSVAQDEKQFNPGNSFDLWRGPTWINTNWFLAKALVNYGYKKEAEELTQKTSDMINKYGFWEFYDPHTGEGYGQPNFGWSTLVLDMAKSF